MLCEDRMESRDLLQIICLNPCSNGRCSASYSNSHRWHIRWVLILVLMEDALREIRVIPKTNIQWSLNPCSNGRCSARFLGRRPKKFGQVVLILVLMEDALRVVLGVKIVPEYRVLILVLMEDALRDFVKDLFLILHKGLNPCSNGRCSASLCEKILHFDVITCFNPCSNGRCSASVGPSSLGGCFLGLNPCSNGRCSARTSRKFWTSFGCRS